MVLKSKHDILVPVSLFFITIITRLPFTSKILSHWDSVSFALATERYDITIHQPHPPGYFLYVMLGKFVNHFIHDANTSFVAMSVVASGLTVAAIYVLANRMYDRMTALGASVLAITSPLFWFYSEVALTYMLEAFCSVSLAYLCWRILNGERKLIFLSAVLLAIAGGIRQSTLVFLMPLWLYSIRKSSKTQILISFLILAAGILSWFLPMLSMSGGYAQYKAVVDEYWAYNFEPFTVLNVGLEGLFSYAIKFIQFITAGLLLCTAFLTFYMFKAGFKNIGKELFSKKGIFIAVWIMPYIAALLYVFMKAAIPGYFLLFMPALLMVSVSALKSITQRGHLVNRMFVFSVLLTIVFNLYYFFLVCSPISICILKRQHAYISDVVKAMRAKFSPSDTIILSHDYLLNGARHFMYYLPEYRTYLMDERVDLRGRRIKVHWWQDHNTFTSDTVCIPKGTRYFVSPVADKSVLTDIKEVEERINILSERGTGIAFYGDVSLAPKAYSGVRFEIEK